MTKDSHPYFLLSGQFDPDDITNRLRMEPSWTQKIGDPGPPDALGPRLGAVWAWQAQDDDSDDLGDQLAYMAATLSMKRELVAELSRDFFGTLHVSCTPRSGREGWFLSPDLIRLLVDLRVSIEAE